MLFVYQFVFPRKNYPFVCVNKEANDPGAQKGSLPLAKS